MIFHFWRKIPHRCSAAQYNGPLHAIEMSFLKEIHWFGCLFSPSIFLKPKKISAVHIFTPACYYLASIAPFSFHKKYSVHYDFSSRSQTSPYTSMSISFPPESYSLISSSSRCINYDPPSLPFFYAAYNMNNQYMAISYLSLWFYSFI